MHQFSNPPTYTCSGDVNNFNQNLMYGFAYDRCIACSETIRSAYAAGGFDFLESVLNNPDSLEDITGLRKVKEEADLMLTQLEADDAANVDSEDGEWTM